MLRYPCSGRVLRDLRLELSRRTFLLNFLSDQGYFQFSTSCLAMIFGEIGQFLFVDDLPVCLLMEFQALLDECVKLMLITVSIQCSRRFLFRSSNRAAAAFCLQS